MITTHELAWHLDDLGVQIYDAPDHRGQWLTLPVHCPVCDARWHVVVPLHSVGAECPFCGYLDEAQYWTDDTTPECQERTH
jgi:hypothetical protein